MNSEYEQVMPTGRRPSFEPTPEEIRAACLEIQESWDEREERSRRVTGSPSWQVRQISDQPNQG